MNNNNTLSIEQDAVIEAAQEEQERASVKLVTIRRSCGHKEQVELDASTKSWKQHMQSLKCLACEPTMKVTRYCGHEETVARMLVESPRRRDSLAMQECASCRH
jgi:hypothetical protein